MLDTLLQTLKTSQDHVALTGHPVSALHRFAGKLIEQLEHERSLHVENYVPGDTEALLARFNQLIAGLSADQAFSRQHAVGPTSLVFVVHIEAATQAESVFTLARLCNALPGARARMLLIVDDAACLADLAAALGPRLVSVEIDPAMAARASAVPVAPVSRVLPGAALVDDDAFAEEAPDSRSGDETAAQTAAPAARPTPVESRFRPSRKPGSASSLNSSAPTRQVSSEDSPASTAPASTASLKSGLARAMSRFDFRQWPLAAQMGGLIVLGLGGAMAVHLALAPPTSPQGPTLATPGALAPVTAQPAPPANSTPAAAPPAASASAPAAPSTATPAASPSAPVAASASPPATGASSAAQPKFGPASSTSTPPAAKSSPTPSAPTAAPSPPAATATTTAATTSAAAASTAAASTAAASTAGSAAAPTAATTTSQPAPTIPFACTPTTGSVPRFQARSPSKAGDMVYLVSTVKQRVCITAADGSLQDEMLEPEIGRSFYGKQPLQVQAEQMRNLRVFFQGARIAIPASAGSRIELVER
jgi:hypothetical protein